MSQVLNKGPSAILEGEIYLLWPSHNKAGEPILYLMDQPEVKGNAICEPFPNANELRLTVSHPSSSANIIFLVLCAFLILVRLRIPLTMHVHRHSLKTT